jgi:hypothetical protein
MSACRHRASLVVLWLLFAAVCQAATVTLDPADRGWYMKSNSDSGQHDPTKHNYLVGIYTGDYAAQFRNFFVFDLTGVAGRVIGAELVVNTLEIVGGDQTYGLYDVATPVASLTAGGSNQDAIFTDLGNGAIYGSQIIPQSLSDPTLAFNRRVEIPLNAAFVSAANAAGGLFAIGGALMLNQGPAGDRYVFGYGDVAPPSCSQLIVETMLAAGDANRDGAVNGADLNIVLSNYNTASAATWAMGDFNGDGQVNGVDLNTILSNYNQGVAQASSLSSPAAVPEPTTLAMLVILVLGLWSWVFVPRSWVLA